MWPLSHFGACEGLGRQIGEHGIGRAGKNRECVRIVCELVCVN